MEETTKEIRTGLSVVKFNTSKLPVFKEEKSKDWIVYGTEKEFYNRYPDYLQQCYNRSGKHSAIIQAKVKYVCGGGFEIDKTGLKVFELASGNTLLLKANKYDETFDDIVVKVALDDEIFGGFYLEIVWDKKGKNFDIYHMDYACIRASKNGEDFYYSNDWSKKEQSEEATGFKSIPAFDPENKSGNQLLWVKQYRPGLKWYPLPSYIGIIPYIECDFEISNYHLSNIKTNFNIGTIINFNNGKPSAEEKEAIETGLKEKFEGTDKSGSLLITFNQNKENAPTIEHMAVSDLDKQFIQLNEQVRNEIFIGHSITNPALMGVISDKGFTSGREQIDVDYELFKNTYVEPKQKRLCKVFNMLLALRGGIGKLKLKEMPPLIEKLSEDTLKITLTKNELRELAGYPKIDINPTIDALTTMSPLVANNIIGNLTVNELRSLIGLPSIANGDEINSLVPATTPENQQLIRHEKKINTHTIKCEHHFVSDEVKMKACMNTFKKFARSKADYDIVLSRQIDFASDKERDESEAQFTFGVIDKDEVKDIYRDVLDLISKDPLISAKDIATAINSNEAKVSKAISKLKEQGAITEKKVTGQEGKIEHRTISDKAQEVLNEQPANVSDFVVMYSYEPRAGLPKYAYDDNGKLTTRDFCIELLEVNGLYTREDIEQISSKVGWDVFTHRGGYWHKKGTDYTYPYCRHIWQQNIVKLKSK